MTEGQPDDRSSRLVSVRVAEAVALARAVFEQHGTPRAHSTLVAETLVAADQCGIRTHGIARVPLYVRAIQEDRLDVAASPALERDAPAASLWDARHAFGQVCAAALVDHACARALEAGAHIAVCHSSNHFGHAGHWAARAARRGLLGMVFTTGSPVVVPTAGTRPELGTNPIAFALEGESDTFLLDMSTSVVSLGKLEVAARSGQLVPAGWAVDAAGEPISEPASFLGAIRRRDAGGLLPLGGGSTDQGGHKGYGLAAVVEILCAVLSGGADVTPGTTVDERGSGWVAHCVLVVDPDRLAGRTKVRRALDRLITALRASPPVDRRTPVQVAGDPERVSLERSRHDVLVERVAWQRLVDLNDAQT